MTDKSTEYFFQQYQQNKEKSLELARLIQKAAKEIHADMLAKKECQELWDAKKLQSKDEMWRVLQNHLRKYADQIIQSTWFTGLTIVPVTQELYDQMTLPDVWNQIDLLIGAIHVIRLNHWQRAAFKECLKSLMKKNGNFSSQEIELIFPDF